MRRALFALALAGGALAWHTEAHAQTVSPLFNSGTTTGLQVSLVARYIP